MTLATLFMCIHLELPTGLQTILPAGHHMGAGFHIYSYMYIMSMCAHNMSSINVYKRPKTANCFAILRCVVLPNFSMRHLAV